MFRGKNAGKSVDKGGKAVQNAVDKLKFRSSYPQQIAESPIKSGFQAPFLWITLWIMWKIRFLQPNRIIQRHTYWPPLAIQGNTGFVSAKGLYKWIFIHFVQMPPVDNPGG